MIGDQQCIVCRLPIKGPPHVSVGPSIYHRACFDPVADRIRRRATDRERSIDEVDEEPA